MRPNIIFAILLSWLSVQLSNSQTYVTVGENASYSSFRTPYYNYFRYSTVQMLYTPTEIGKSGKINSIAFKVASAYSLTTSAVNVYLGHKSSKFSGTNDYVRSSNLTLVYSGTPTLGQTTGWETLTFNKGSFTYNGTDNLVVVVTRKSSGYHDNLKYYYFEGSGYTLRRGSDNYANYADVTNTSYSYSTSTERPSVRIGIEGSQTTDNAVNTVTIGDNASYSSYTTPYYNIDRYSTVQMLYTPTEIGKSGKINSIAFKVASAYSLTTSAVNVYLGHKSSKFSGTSDYVRSSNLTLVYSGTPTLGQTTGWETLTFNKGSFTYNGTDNLVVVVTKNSSGFQTELKYYYFEGSGYTLRRGNDIYANYADVTNTSYSYSTSTERPSVRIGIEGSQTTDNAVNTVTIGDNATYGNNVLPFRNYYRYSTSQMFYTPAEIGRSGKINSVAFKVRSAKSQTTSEVNVYLGHKSSKFSGKYDYVRSSNLMLVYSGAPTLGQTTGWETLTFNKGSFTYNGTDNLVVVVTKKSSSYATSEYYYFSGEVSLSRASDDYTNYANVANTSYSYDTYSYRPTIKLNFEAAVVSDTDYSLAGVKYTLHTNGTATVKALVYNWTSVNIPSTVNYNGAIFNVTEVGASAFSSYPSYNITLPSSITTIHSDAFNNSKALSVIWNSPVKLTASHINKMKALTPNVLIYVNNTSQLYTTDLQNTKNVVISATAQTVELNDGYDFHCPKQFTANAISYKRNFRMTSGVRGSSAGWETIVLPFTVSTISHSGKGELVPFYSYSRSSSKKPFWLYSWGASGWEKASRIAYNTPYLICMPNNEYYQSDYNISGEVTFSATGATIYVSPTSRYDYSSSYYDSSQFYPSFVAISKEDYIYTINSGTTSSETGNETAGSAFIKKLRNVKPFEGYIYNTISSSRIFTVNPFSDGETTDILEINNENRFNNEIIVYNINGMIVAKATSANIEKILGLLPKGIYFINGKKVTK